MMILIKVLMEVERRANNIKLNLNNQHMRLLMRIKWRWVEHSMVWGKEVGVLMDMKLQELLNWGRRLKIKAYSTLLMNIRYIWIVYQSVLLFQQIQIADTQVHFHILILLLFQLFVIQKRWQFFQKWKENLIQQSNHSQSAISSIRAQMWCYILTSWSTSHSYWLSLNKRR